MQMRNLFATFLLFCPMAVMGQTLQITPSSTELMVHPGDTDVPVSVSVSAPGTQMVSLTLIGLPAGFQVTPAMAGNGQTATLKVSVSKSAGSGAFADDSTKTTVGSTATLIAYAQGQTAAVPIHVDLSIANPSYAPATGTIDLPIVRIDTGGVAIVDKTTNVPGTITITSANGAATLLPGAAGTDNTATFRLRGNSTATLPKPPFRIKLNTSTDLLTGLGVVCPYTTGTKAICSKSKTYALLANFADKSMLRNAAAFLLAQSIPVGNGYLSLAAGSPTPSGNNQQMIWAPHSVFVDVYVNGTYDGVYQLAETVLIDSHRVNITSMAQTDISGDAVTGGYLTEFNFRADETTNFPVPHATWGVSVDDPDFGVVVPEQKSYISNTFSQADAALFAPSYTDPATGWRKYFDEASLVNYYIVNTLVSNWDSGRLAASAYLFKQRSNPSLYFGPAWDFDLSAGNMYDVSLNDPFVADMSTRSPWLVRFFSDPTLKADVATQWKKLRSAGVIDTWLANVQAQGIGLRSAADRNYKRWPYLGVYVWVEQNNFASYDESVQYLLAYLNARVAFLDQQFGYTGSGTSSFVLRSASAFSADTLATLVASLSPAPSSGSVVFEQAIGANTAMLGQATVQDGTATFTGRVSAGASTFKAVFLGNGSQKPLTATLGATVAPSLLQTVTLLSRVGAQLQARVLASSGSGVPTGTIRFTADNLTCGVVQLPADGVLSIDQPTTCNVGHVLMAMYSGDGKFSASTSTALSATTAAQATVTTALAKAADGSYQMTVTVNNSGSAVASDVQLTAATLGASSTTTSLPLQFGTIAAGSSTALVLYFPASAGSTGMRTSETIGGTYSTGSFSLAQRLVLP